MTPSTAAFLLEVLSHIQINAGDPDFDKIAAQVTAARTELTAALDPPPPAKK